MTRILTYGGCHADVLARLITEHAEEPAIQMEVLINFELIRSGKPFVFERLGSIETSGGLIRFQATAGVI